MKVAVIEGRVPTLMEEGPVVERQVLGPSVDVSWHGILDPTEYGPVLGEADAVILRSITPFPDAMVRALTRGRVIVTLGVGYDQVGLEAAKAREIPVCNVPDYGTEEVADATMAMLLAHQRKLLLFRHRFDLEALTWDWRLHRPVRRSRSLQAGIIGLGRIGTAVALRLKAFGHAVVFYDPYVSRGVEKALGVDRLHDLESLLRSADIVTVHTPLTSETAGLIDDRFFSLLKPQAIVLNTARGGIFKHVDTLERWLRERTELRIGTDVWPEEPPARHPLVTAWKQGEGWLGDRLILTPHAAFYSEESVRDMRASAASIVKTVLEGGRPYNVVNGVTGGDGHHLLRSRR